MAAVMPATPEHSSLNAVVYKRKSALTAALHDIGAAYGEAGVRSWMVWVPVVDDEASKLLKRAGLQLNPNFTAMARELQPVERPPLNTLEEWTSAGDPATLAAIADPPGSMLGPPFMRAFSNLAPGRARVYIASLDGKPVCCFMTGDENGNCAVDLVATRPEARGRGLAGALLAQAVADAAERGCVTTTLVSSLKAQSLYKRAGYRVLCPLLRWERLPR
jgi:ribosomal protein S18 acetylase RimI-like enzyme